MELSRRGMVGGLVAIGAAGAVGFVGASAVDEPARSGTDEDPDGSNTGYVEADHSAPFMARLLDGTDEHDLFTAEDLVHVEGVHPDDGEHLVVIELSDAGRKRFQETLESAGAAADPDPFEIVMALDGATVREVDLDEATVDALADDGWEGVVTLPFDDEAVAEDVYEALAAE